MAHLFINIVFMLDKTKGYGKYPRAIAMDPQFSAREKVIFGILCCNINHKLNYTWITISEIAACTPCHPNTVKRALDKFKQLKLIERGGFHKSKGRASVITRILIKY